jgi:hypothetical protein
MATASLVVRFRRARSVERQQLRWVALGTVLIALLAIVHLTALTLGAMPWRHWRADSTRRSCRRPSARPSSATGCTTWTGSSAAPSPMRWWPWGWARCWVRTPDDRRLRRPPPRPGRPGRPGCPAAGGGRGDDAADPGVALAATANPLDGGRRARPSLARSGGTTDSMTRTARAQCRPPRSGPVCRPADTVPSCGVALVE